MIWIIIFFTTITNFSQAWNSITLEDDSVESRMWEAILDGDPVDPKSNAIKTTVRLIVSDQKGNSKNCTGVVLSERYVLSSGHCFWTNDLSIEVQFPRATGGFYVQQALAYRSFEKELSSNDFSTDYSNGFLSYDRGLSFEFYRQIANRTHFKNFPEYGEKLFDLALVKIENLPERFQPTRIYRGELDFGQWGYSAGFGLNDRDESGNDSTLRTGSQKIIGVVQDTESPKGFQIYSPERKNVCMGDSGGPFFVQNSTGSWELLGIHTFVFNNCANSTFIFYPGNTEIRELLEKWMSEMDSIESI